MMLRYTDASAQDLIGDAKRMRVSAKRECQAKLPTVSACVYVLHVVDSQSNKVCCIRLGLFLHNRIRPQQWLS